MNEWKSPIIGGILNGNYPEAALKRPSPVGLQRFVGRLIQDTSASKKKHPKKPKWWPVGLSFTDHFRVPEKHKLKNNLALTRLISSCSHFFQKSKWLTEWNDENRKTINIKRSLANNEDSAPSSKRQKFEETHENVAILDQNQFLEYFKLESKNEQKPESERIGVISGPKLAFCTHIPFSSDMGRILADREQHRMSEILKLKRLERCEWYINKSGQVKEDIVKYESSFNQRQGAHSHWYVPPKRQNYQKRQSWYSEEFLKKFCTPVVVRLEKMDLDLVKKRWKQKRQVSKKKLIVRITRHDKNVVTKRNLIVRITKNDRECCDNKTNTSTDKKLMRRSPRLLRNI